MEHRAEAIAARKMPSGPLTSTHANVVGNFGLTATSV
jgi:hypothetical protein